MFFEGVNLAAGSIRASFASFVRVCVRATWSPGHLPWSSAALFLGGRDLRRATWSPGHLVTCPVLGRPCSWAALFLGGRDLRRATCTICVRATWPPGHLVTCRGLRRPCSWAALFLGGRDLRRATCRDLQRQGLCAVQTTFVSQRIFYPSVSRLALGNNIEQLEHFLHRFRPYISCYFVFWLTAKC